MKTWKIKASISVADSWVTDGFNLKDHLQEIEVSILNLLPYAYDYEIRVKVQIVSSPDEKQIEALQNGDTEPKD